MFLLSFPPLTFPFTTSILSVSLCFFLICLIYRSYSFLQKVHGFLYNAKEPTRKSTVAKAAGECAECTVLLLCVTAREEILKISIELIKNDHCFLWRKEESTK